MQAPGLHHFNAKSLPCRCTRVPANAKHTSWKTILVLSYLQASGNCVLQARESQIPCWAPTPSWQALLPPLQCAALTAPSNTAVRYGRFWPQTASPWGCSFTMVSVTCLSTSRVLLRVLVSCCVLTVQAQSACFSAKNSMNRGFVVKSYQSTIMNGRAWKLLSDSYRGDDHGNKTQKRWPLEKVIKRLSMLE